MNTSGDGDRAIAVVNDAVSEGDVVCNEVVDLIGNIFSCADRISRNSKGEGCLFGCAAIELDGVAEIVAVALGDTISINGFNFRMYDFSDINRVIVVDA